MTRLASALRLEVTLQVRQRFLHAAVFSGLIWLAVLLPMPRSLRRVAERDEIDNGESGDLRGAALPGQRAEVLGLLVLLGRRHLPPEGAAQRQREQGGAGEKVSAHVPAIDPML